MTAGAPRKELGPQINPWRIFQGSFIPNAVMQLPRRRMTSEAKICYGRLLRFAGKRGVAFPHVRTLALEVGLSRRSVFRALRQLRELGLITSQHRGRGTTALIRFHLPADVFGDVCPRPAVPHLALQKPVGVPDVAPQSRGHLIERARAVNLSHRTRSESPLRGGAGSARGRVFTQRGNPKGQQRVANLLAGIVKRT
jgi:DNA-binding transcriptional MocR family regulator